MNPLEARLNEITEARKGFLEELSKEGITQERIAEIETETATLDTEEKALRAKMDIKSRMTQVMEKPEGNPEEKNLRDKEIKESGKMEISAQEVRTALKASMRSTVIGTDTLTQPTKVSGTIHDDLNMVSSIIDQVYSQDLTGCSAFEEPYVKTEPEASNRADGEANSSTSDPVFRVAKLAPYLLNVTSYVSKNIERVTPTAYVEKVRSLAIKALRRKAADLIVNGVSGSFNGIKIAKNTKSETICKAYKVTSPTIGATTLRDIVFQYGGNDELGPNARLFLTKEDLAAFGAVRGTNEKKAIYEITADSGNANTGTIKDGGTIVPYTIMSGLTSLSKSTRGSADIQTMIYGDPMNFELGLFGPYTVEVSKDYKFAEGLLTIMGECMVGGNVIVDEGFVVVTLEKTA